MKPMIDWFDEHGRKVYDQEGKRWQRDDLLPPLPTADHPHVPVFDLANVAKLIDRDGDPFKDGVARVKDTIGASPFDLMDRHVELLEAIRDHHQSAKDRLIAMEARMEAAEGDPEAEAAVQVAWEELRAELTSDSVDEEARHAVNAASWQETWAAMDLSYQEAFPNVRPPYGRFWCEWPAGGRGTVPGQMGFSVLVATGDEVGDTAVRLTARLYCRSSSGTWPGPVVIGTVDVGMRETGTITSVKFEGFNDRDTIDEARTAHLGFTVKATSVLLLALSLMNARNIAQVAERPAGQTKKRAQRGLPPEREVRTLRLDGKYVERATDARPSEGTSSKRRHTYRGHWKEYGMKPGQGLLFGKYQCRVYVPDGARGAADLGVVDKRYVVVPWPKTASG